MASLAPLLVPPALALLTTFAVTGPVARWARARGLLDDALGLRRDTGRPVPRLGGLGVHVGFAVGVAAAGLVGFRLGGFAPLLACAAMIAALGLYDDARGAGADIKFAVEFAVALLLFAGGFRVHSVLLPGAGSVELGALALPVTLLWVVGACNAMNLIDGMDGLCAGVATLAAAALGAAAILHGDNEAAVICLALSGAALGFFPWNRRPAKIFLGDGGSLFLGFVIAAATLRPAAPMKGAFGGDLLVPAMAMGLPLFATAWAILRRLRSRRRLFMADALHVHHRLAARFGEARAVTILHAVALAFGAAAVALARG